MQELLEKRYTPGELTTFDGTETFGTNKRYYKFETTQLNGEYQDLFFTTWYFNVIVKELNFIGDGDQRVAISEYAQVTDWTSGDFAVPSTCPDEGPISPPPSFGDE